MSSQFPDFEIFKRLYQQRLASLLQCVSTMNALQIMLILLNVIFLRMLIFFILNKVLFNADLYSTTISNYLVVRCGKNYINTLT